MKSGILTINTTDTVEGKPLSSTVHTYQIAGSQYTRKTETANLQQKLIDTALKESNEAKVID